MAAQTDSLIKQLPLASDPDMLLVLASALSIRLRWEQSLTGDALWIDVGPMAT
ncbi:MAG: hypothetical protein ACRDPW_08490 [Mycobacteriales bacterium]